MNRDQNVDHTEDDDPNELARYRILVGARLTALGAPGKHTWEATQIDDSDDDEAGHAWSVKQD